MLIRDSIMTDIRRTSSTATSFRKFSLDYTKERIRKYSENFVEGQENFIERKKDVNNQIINAVGGSGKWQIIKCVYICVIIWMPASFHLLNMVFFR